MRRSYNIKQHIFVFAKIQFFSFVVNASPFSKVGIQGVS